MGLPRHTVSEDPAALEEPDPWGSEAAGLGPLAVAQVVEEILQSSKLVYLEAPPELSKPWVQG